MRGLRFLGASRVEVVDLPDPDPQDGEVVVQLNRSALCGSELKAYRGAKSLQSNPGHEGMGTVVDTRRTKRYRPGDRVGIHAVWGCGRCHFCLSGRYTFCDARRTTPATHAEYLAAPEHVLVPLDSDVDDDAGVLLSGDAMGLPYHVNSHLETKGGDVVCIVGVGPVGLGNILMQSFLGAEVIAIDVNPYRLDLAKTLGAAHTINPRSHQSREAVSDLTGGRLAAAAVECAGRPETLRLALQLVGKAGTVIAVGEQGDTAINVSRDLIRRDIRLIGSWYYHYAEYPEILDMYRRGLQVKKVITHSFPLANGPEAFHAFAAGETGKVTLQITGRAECERANYE